MKKLTLLASLAILASCNKNTGFVPVDITTSKPVQVNSITHNFTTTDTTIIMNVGAMLDIKSLADSTSVKVVTNGYVTRSVLMGQGEVRSFEVID